MSIWKQECLFTEGTDCWVSWYRHRTVAHIEMWPNKAPSGIKSHLWRQCNYMACFKPCNFRIWKIAPFILGTRAQTFNLLSWNARCRNRKTLSPWQIASFIVILWHWKCPPPFKPVFKAHFPDNVPSSGRLSWYDQFPNLLYFLSPCSGGNTKQQKP